jgi:hypothetical protein
MSTAAVSAASAEVGSAASAVEAAATAADVSYAATTVEAAACVTATSAAVGTAGISANVPATVVSAATVVVIVAAAVSESAATIAPAVKPRASADEQATDEVVRAVVAVRSAGIGIIAVVAVGTDRRCAVVASHGAYADAHAYANLRASVTGCEQTNCN